MSFLDRLERALGRYAIPNAGLYLVIGQAFVLLACWIPSASTSRRRW